MPDDLNFHSKDSKPTLLAVLAHPDDETFGMGGTLALYAQRGVQVYLVCATRGEVGEMDAEYLRGYASIAERREDELRCAAGHLGLKGVYFLGYRDSGMPGSPDNQHPQALAAQPTGEVARAVARSIRELRPQVVLTFDPIGGYRHPDHIAIQRATVEAFRIAGDEAIDLGDGQAAYRPQRLYFHTMPRAFLRVAVVAMRLLGRDPHKFGKNGDIDLASIAEVRFPTHAAIDYRAVAQLRDEAAECHASQGGGQMSRGPVAWLRRLFSSRETFMQAEPAPNGKQVIHDLFDGVKVD